MRNQFEVATCPLAGNDAGQAGRRVVAEAFGRLEGGKADAVLLFAGSGADLPQLLAGAKAAAGPATVVGCTTAGEIGPLGLQKGTVVAAALRFPGHRMVAAAAPQVGLDARAAGRRLADDIVRAVGAHSLRGTLLLFADGLTCDGMALVDAIYDELGPGVHVMGGFAGDDWHFATTWQFHDATVLSDSVVGLFLDEVELGFSVRHGFRAEGEPLLVTRVDGKKLVELANEPPLRAYLDYFGLPQTAQTAELDQRGLTPAFFPLGIPKIAGEYMVRCFLNIEPDGSIIFNSRIPEHAIVRIMTSTRAALLEASRQAALEARAKLGPRHIAGALVVNCCSRTLCLADESAAEVAGIRAALGSEVPVIGFYSYGEFGRYANAPTPPMLLNETCVVGVFGR